jgi:hypothetical protein
MTATLHVLHSKGQTIGGFLRVGHTGHRKLEAHIAASRLRFRRFVFDAAHKRIYVPELDRSFKQEQLDVLFAVRGTRARFGCNDTSCCPHGPEDMMENPHRHFIIQRSRQIENLSDVPESRRAEHFLLNHLDPAVRSARLVSRLKLGNDDVAKIVSETKKRLINLRDPLGDLHSTSVSATRSATPKFRGESPTMNSAVG